MIRLRSSHEKFYLNQFASAIIETIRSLKPAKLL